MLEKNCKIGKWSPEAISKALRETHLIPPRLSFWTIKSFVNIRQKVKFTFKDI